MKLDPNDDDLLLGLPYDPEPEDSSSQQTPAKKVRMPTIPLTVVHSIQLISGTQVSDIARQSGDNQDGAERGKKTHF